MYGLRRRFSSCRHTKTRYYVTRYRAVSACARSCTARHGCSSHETTTMRIKAWTDGMRRCFSAHLLTAVKLTRYRIQMTTSTRPAPLAFGDLQGCHSEFQRLLAKAAPSDDTPLWFAGDIVNRGPGLPRDIARPGRARRPRGDGARQSRPASAIGFRRHPQAKERRHARRHPRRPDAADLLEWVRHRPIAHFDNDMLLVHAGVPPQWDAALTMELADELQRALRAPTWKETLAGLYAMNPIAGSPA